jgi:hypothetical protein
MQNTILENEIMGADQPPSVIQHQPGCDQGNAAWVGLSRPLPYHISISRYPPSPHIRKRISGDTI